MAFLQIAILVSLGWGIICLILSYASKRKLSEIPKLEQVIMIDSPVPFYVRNVTIDDRKDRTEKEMCMWGRWATFSLLIGFTLLLFHFNH
jgi:hypothetical protein